MSSPAPTIAILGGGTAGWMAACLMAKAWPAAAITVIESPEIGIIGVGEGSTPQLRGFFETVGIAERDWMPACHATYKTGIAFHGWSDRPGFDRYFHPFASAVDLHTEPAFHYNALTRRSGGDVPAHPDRFFLNAVLAERRLAPIAPERFPFEVGYGYHFDAHLVGARLQRRAAELGVAHLARRVTEVMVGEGGDVTHLLLEGGDTVAADLFVDASGFRSAIAQAALGVRFLPFAANLFNDRAVTIPTSIDADAVAPQTTATALSAGWAWRIPLTSRAGNGYVYSSAHMSPDQAEAELRAHLGASAANIEARHLTMRVGRVEDSWRANCLAVGLAQGFIEPLEATALHLVQTTVEAFVAAWEGGGFTPAGRAAFNGGIARRYEGIRDYIVCHYRVNGRRDTAYWRDNAANDHLSDSLKGILTAWFTRADIVAEIERQDIGGYYAPLSWECLLAGYGAFPDPATLRPAPDRVGLPAIDDTLRRCALNFPDHAQTLRDLARPEAA